MAQFEIHGGRPLRGEVVIGGSKNAALPILAATLLTKEECVLKNVPDIEDVRTMLSLLRSLGGAVEFHNHTVRVRTKTIEKGKLSNHLCSKMRASVLLAGALLARAGFAHLPYPGGCVLGARPIDTHLDIFRQYGVRQLKSPDDEIVLKGRPRGGEIVMPEFSVTATENAILLAAGARKATTVRLAAVEPHVQDLCGFLRCVGVDIEGVGTHTLRISPAKKFLGARHTIAPDYLETGTFVIAALVTRGDVTIKNIDPHDLDAFWNLLGEMGACFELAKNAVKIKSNGKYFACRRLQTNVFPGFPTDLQPPFVVLLTQARGESLVHETLFEGRFKYFSELIKMGAHIKKLNPHEAVITGPVRLRGASVRSNDIRAGAGMILAGLAARGRTIARDVHYIDRGYENFDEKLRKLGADIKRMV